MQASDSSPTKALDRESLRNIGSELESHFPHLAEETELVLMDISPHRLHAYWHITPWDLESASVRAKDEDSCLVMRFHDLTDRDPNSLLPPWFDLEITQHSGSQYVELWKDAQSYVAELGLLTSAGKLIDLTRSNQVELPRAGHAPTSGTQVLTLTPLAAGLFEQPTEFNAEKTLTGRQGEVWREDKNQPEDATLQGGTPALFPRFPTPDLVTGEAQPIELPTFPRVEAAIAISWIEQEAPPGDALSASSRSEATRQGGETAAIEGFPLSPVEGINELARIGNIPVVDLISMESAGQIPLASRLAPFTDLTEFSPPAAEPHTETAPATTSVSSPMPPPVSSFKLGLVEDEELHMELHIRGRKQPNTQFILFGQPIPTQEDGTFSLFRTLPPHTQQLVAQLLAASQEE